SSDLDLGPGPAGGAAYRPAVRAVRVELRLRLAGVWRLPAHLFPDRAVGDRPAHPTAARFADPAPDVAGPGGGAGQPVHAGQARAAGRDRRLREPLDRKSTRLNSSHVKISYAVFC